MNTKLWFALLLLGLVVGNTWACLGDPEGPEPSSKEESDEKSGSDEKSPEKSSEEGSDEECLDDDDEEYSDACNSQNLRDMLAEVLTNEGNFGDPNTASDELKAAVEEKYPCGKWIVFCTEANLPASVVENEKKDCVQTIGQMTCRVYAD